MRVPELNFWYAYRDNEFMILKKITAVVFILFFLQVKAQKTKEILFSIDKEPIYTTEFLKVFNKNRDIVDEENKKSIEEYLDLYVNYKLKLKQAYALGLDTLATYKKELNKYREQLIAPYLKDSKVTASLVNEAYSRLKTEVDASHILVRLAPKAAPADTLKAFTKITQARNKVLSGVPFDEVASEYSEDPSARNNGGDLGYFSAFGMVYPFENQAYQTAVNEVSMPFKTSFGYHILKVNDKRPSKGEVEVAHIMIKNKATDTIFAENQIKEVYAKLQQGDAFDFLAKQYSDDKSSAVKGGKLQKFSANRMIKPFSDVAFALKNENDISKPFQTVYGWHIVKLLKKYPIESFEELKEELTKRIEKSERANIVGKSIAGRLKTDYDIKVNTNVLNAFYENNTSVISESLTETIFSINGKNIPLNKLIAYNKTQANMSLQAVYQDFLDKEIIDYYKDNLEKTDAEFAFTIKEYRDGLLLFDLLQDKIWTRAEKDTVALRNFFNENRQNYVWKKRAEVVLASCTRNDKAKLVKKYLEEGKSIDEIKDLVNEGATINVLFSTGALEEGSEKLPSNFSFVDGVSAIYTDDESHFVVVKVNEIMPPAQKELKEAKGKVINDFQEELEKQWIEELRAKYNVKLHKKTVKKLVKQYEN